MQVGVRSRRSQYALPTALDALWLLDRRGHSVGRETVATTAALGLVTVCRILRLMAELFLFSESLPLALDLWWLILPLLANDLGDFRI